MTKKKILLVDDDADFTGLLKLGLENSGPYMIREENNGKGAVRTAREFSPDLILLDMTLPDIDGYEILRRLKADEILIETPVIFLTAAVPQYEIESNTDTFYRHKFISKPAS
ncbi:response regulator, partial [PVC group bacterium]|nr:response regulator [PVC group bacterium]